MRGSKAIRSGPGAAITVTPRIMRVFAYLFVFSTIFDSFTFSFTRANDNVSRLLGIILLGLFLLLPGRKVHLIGRDLKWYLMFFLVTLFEEALRFLSLDSSEAAFSLLNYFSYVQVLAMYVILRDITRDHRAFRGVITVYLTTFLAVSILTNLGVSFAMKRGAGGRVGLAGMNLNQLAFVLAAIVVCIVSWLLAEWSGPRLNNLLLVAAAGSLVLSLVRTGSRGGALAFASGLFLSMLIHIRVRRLPAYLLLVPLIVGGVLLVATRSEVLTGRIRATVHEGDTGSRLELTEAGLILLREKPLAGWGPAYAYELGPLVGVLRISAHNSYLQMLLSFGVLGFVPLIIAVGMTLRRAWRLRASVWGSMWFTVLAMTLIFGITGHLGYSKHFWIIVALTANVDVMVAWQDKRKGLRPSIRVARNGLSVDPRHQAAGPAGPNLAS